MPIERTPFGRTGHHSSRVIFGGAALSHVSQAEADEAFERLMAAGVNHLDLAASYGDAEVRIRPCLARAPGELFVATKTDQRTAAGAREQLERSLERMGVDHVDLWQLHNLVDPIDWDRALSPGGALEAAIAAKQEGLVRFIGVTGHGAQVAATHRRSLERFDFASVLLPYNYVTMKNDYYASNFEALTAAAAERGFAVQTIKSLARRPWAGREHTAGTWYEPVADQDDIDLAVWWALGRPGIFVASVGDIGILPKMLSAASRFSSRPADHEMEDMLRRLDVEPLFV